MEVYLIVNLILNKVVIVDSPKYLENFMVVIISFFVCVSIMYPYIWGEYYICVHIHIQNLVISYIIIITIYTV